MKVQDQIRIQREKLGMTRKQVAEHLGVSEQTVRYWEGQDSSGRVSQPNKKTLPLLEDLLQFNIDFTEGRAARKAGGTALSQVDIDDFAMLSEIARLPQDSKRVIRDLLKVHVAAIDAARGMTTGQFAPVAAFEEAAGSEQSAARKTRGGRRAVATAPAPMRRTG